MYPKCDACIHDACIHDVCTHDTNIHGAFPPAAAAAPPIESMVFFRHILSMGGAAAAGADSSTIWLDIYDRKGEATWRVFGLLAYTQKSFLPFGKLGGGGRCCGLSVTLESSKLGQVG